MHILLVRAVAPVHMLAGTPMITPRAHAHHTYLSSVRLERPRKILDNAVLSLERRAPAVFFAGFAPRRNDALVMPGSRSGRGNFMLVEELVREDVLLILSR